MAAHKIVSYKQWMSTTIGARIRQARTQAHMTQRALGDALGVSSQAVTKWETGNTTPTLENVIAAAKELGTSVQWLLFGTLTGQTPNGTMPLTLTGGRSVPMLAARDAARRVATPRNTETQVFSHFPCGNRSFAVELVDDSNAPQHPKGARWIIDPDQKAAPGCLVLAAVGADVQPAFGEWRQEATAAGIVTIVAPLNTKWPARRSDVEPIDIIGVATEAIHPVRAVT